MKITPGNPESNRIDPANADRTSPGRLQPAAPAAAGDTIRISDLSTRLAALETRMAGSAPFDAGRVEAIKGAIRDGQFKVNADVVANRLIESVRELLVKRP